LLHRACNNCRESARGITAVEGHYLIPKLAR
jgi:hypothetical protein